MENNNFITEDFVGFETAKLLKDCGFEAEVKTWWDDEGNMYKASDEYPVLSNYDGKDWLGHLNFECIAPTLNMALKFIRKRYNYHIIATPEYGDVEYMPGQWQEEFIGWKYSIIPLKSNESIMHPTVYAKTPESACEEGVKFMLNRKI